MLHTFFKGHGDGSTKLEREGTKRFCDNCVIATTSEIDTSKIGLWECDDCNETLCNACKNIHHEQKEKEQENQETGEVKLHIVKPLQFSNG